jgi:hypothetical protein
MFQIHQEQFEAFNQIARANFHRHLAAYLREVMPAETAAYSDDALLEYIVTSDRRASAHGIETESGIAQWACLALIIGIDFDDDPMVHEYFKIPGRNSEEKLEILVNSLNEALLGPSEAQA